jgi:hypothetical protein
MTEDLVYGAFLGGDGVPGVIPSPQNSRASRSNELIAGLMALKQTLRVCLRACFKINRSKQIVF